ncbi:MAG TPA: 3'-5' exonuclease, partial [Tenuifilaceae bacterium]|nr:3'-5' exonuclease [Tenuifilaceae bacterium]
IREFIEARRNEGIDETTTLVDYLENVALLTSLDNDDPNDRNRISVMTIHSAKGLEFDYVFLTGLEENLFPSNMSMNTPEELEEERRLFYVALTRAAKGVTISFAQTRLKWGNINISNPSRFISEIDQRYVESPFEPDGGGHLKATSELSRQTSINNFGKNSIGNRVAPYSQPPGRTPVSVPENLKELPPEEICEGVEVYHGKFGQGKVLSVEGEGANKKATVLFTEAGQKNLLIKFANLKGIA